MSGTIVREEILAIVAKGKPETISDLLAVLSRDFERDAGADLRAVRSMVQDGALAVQPGDNRSLIDKIIPPAWFLPALVRKLAREPAVRGLTFVLVLNLLSWFLVLLSSTHPVIAATRVAVLAIGFLFLPGFALVAAWYPFPGREQRLPRTTNRPGQAHGSGRDLVSMSVVARVAYSTCYSIALVVLLGFVLALLGAGLDARVMLGSLTLIEALASWSIIRRVLKALDPYNAM